MIDFRVVAVITVVPTGVRVRFSDIFRADNYEKAVELAKQKFIMVQDDLIAEFKDDESAQISLDIISCDLSK